MQKDNPDNASLYRDAGVDLSRAATAKERIRALARSTFTGAVLQDIGSFGGLYSLASLPSGETVLVASADGVGTKLKVAVATGIHDTVGRDLVAHCVNDVLTQGARPLFFLDYIATGHLEVDVVEQVVLGLARECRDNGCALIGGETAQMPDFYAPGEYDLAGFIVGWVRKSAILGPERVREGDVLLGLASSGLHTNGYSLARRLLFEKAQLGTSDPFPGSRESVGAELLKVHRSYLPILEPLLEEETLHALAHITGGGITENLPRVFPEGLYAAIERDSWPVLPVFKSLQELGRIADEEMFRVFNMGLGMILVVDAAGAEAIQKRLAAAGEASYRIGRICIGSAGVQYL